MPILRNVVVTVAIAIASGNAVAQSTNWVAGELRIQLSESAAEAFTLPLPAAKSGGVLPSTGIASLDQLNATYSVESIELWFPNASSFDAEFDDLNLDRWLIISFPASTDLTTIDADYAADSNIEATQINFYLQEDSAPNDPYYGENWGHSNTGQLPSWNPASVGWTGPTVGTPGFDTDMEAAWDLVGHGSEEVTIAVIDSGMYLWHDDLEENLWVNPGEILDGQDTDDNGHEDDIHGWNFAKDSDDLWPDTEHGTRVAGIAAARTNNDEGIAGVAGNCKIMPLVVSSGQEIDACAIVEAILYAAQENAQVANISISTCDGSIPDCGPFNGMIDAAAVYTLIIASAGNRGDDFIGWPANHPKVMAVGMASPCGERKRGPSSEPELSECGIPACPCPPDPLGVTCDNYHRQGSNYGSATKDSEDAIDLLGPTFLPTTTGSAASYGYLTGSDRFGGTSCAAPYVAGVAALVFSRDPWGLWPPDVWEALTSSATDIVNAEAAVGWDRYTGYGMVNALGAVMAPSLSKFENTYNATGFDWGGDPYASLAEDLDGDGDVDLFVTDKGSGERAGWMRHDDNQSAPNLPSFQDNAINAFDSGSDPIALRGASAADFDNDGDLDLFAAAESTPRLYQRGPSSYVDIGENTGTPSFRSLATDSWIGAWADYDRDGRLDLYIGRAGTGTMSGNPSGALADVLLHNDGGGLFSDASSIGIHTGPDLVTASAAFADYNADEDIDLFIGSGDYADSRLLRGSGGGPGAPFVFLDATDELWHPGSADQVRNVGSHWADVDNDGLLDLLIGQADPYYSTGDDVLLFRNDGSGGFHGALEVVTGIDVQTFTVLDYDLDGALDVLASSFTGGESALVLLRNDPLNPGTQFLDVSAAAGLFATAGSPVTALSIADFGGSSGSGADEEDGDLDLYVGRTSSSQEYFYYAKPLQHFGVDTPHNAWIRIRLAPDDDDAYSTPTYGYGHNATGIGATVTVEAPTAGGIWKQSQVVEGGTGHGGQKRTALTFGLGQATGDATVTVEWTDGWTHQTVIPTSAFNQEHRIENHDQHMPEIVQGSMGWGQIPQPGGKTDWEFRWQTKNAVDPNLNAVFVTTEDPQGHRYCPLPDTAVSELWLDANSEDVVMTSEPTVNGRVQHTVTWKNRTCDAPCGFRWKARSGITETRTETNPVLQSFTLPICVE